MAGPFATVADLEEIWRTLDDTDKTKAARLLAAASRKIRLQCPSWAQAEEAEPGICKDICCNMVKRAMVAEETNPEGLSQGHRPPAPSPTAGRTATRTETCTSHPANSPTSPVPAAAACSPSP